MSTSVPNVDINDKPSSAGFPTNIPSKPPSRRASVANGQAPRSPTHRSPVGSRTNSPREGGGGGEAFTAGNLTSPIVRGGGAAPSSRSASSAAVAAGGGNDAERAGGGAAVVAKPSPTALPEMASTPANVLVDMSKAQPAEPLSAQPKPSANAAPAAASSSNASSNTNNVAAPLFSSTSAFAAPSPALPLTANVNRDASVRNDTNADRLMGLSPSPAPAPRTNSNTHPIIAPPTTNNNSHPPPPAPSATANSAAAAEGGPAALTGPGRRSSAADVPRPPPSVRPALSSITGLERVAAIPKLQGSSDRLQERVGTCVHNLMVAKCPERLGHYTRIMAMYEGKEEVLLDALQAVFGDEHFFGKRPDISLLMGGGGGGLRGPSTVGGATSSNNNNALNQTTLNTSDCYATNPLGVQNNSAPRRRSHSPNTTSILTNQNANTSAIGFNPYEQQQQQFSTADAVNAFTNTASYAAYNNNNKNNNNNNNSRAPPSGAVSRSSSIMTPPLPRDLQIGSSSAAVNSRAASSAANACGYTGGRSASGASYF